MTKHLPSPAVLRSTALAGALVALALPASGASAADTHKVIVLGRHSQVVAVFRSAKCQVGRAGHKPLFFSTASNRGYVLQADVIPFKGFDKRYDLRRGHFDPQFLSLHSPSGVDYASDFVPPYPVHHGGAINFEHGGGLMGVGFSPMFSQDGTDAVTVTGVLVCHYAKKKH
jgi:hypothetical protein